MNQPFSGNWKNVSEMEKQRLQDLYMEEKKIYRAKIDEVYILGPYKIFF